MSGPFRFNQQQDSRSPLDRPPPNLFPAGQPPSFKTNVNRSKTKKWVEAKPYSYDGDDWGDVDEYDEYGADQEPQPPPQPAAVAGLRQPGSRFEQSPRSFTDPQHQGFPQPARRNSFEAGEEHRAFSAGTHQPQKPYEQPTYGAPSQSAGIVHPAHRQASAAESDTSDTPQHRRDFLPAALPPPLQTKISPTPGSASGSPLNPKYPIRKSSIGQIDSPGAISPREGTPSNPTKPLPFIRPADIYKRVEEERQRERTASMDSSRPSLDSLSSRPREDTTSPGPDALGRSADPAKSLQPLETVSEGRSEYQPNYNAAAQSQQSQSQSDYSFQPPSLPQVRRISAFDNDFWSGDQQQQTNDGHAPFASPSDDQGFRSVVNQAFTRTDDQRSIPPTPISKSDSGMSRSNTESTSGISPIMSRVPSSATSALKNRNNAGGDTPMIAEEASESSTPVSRPTSQMLGGSHQIARKPSPTSHARDFSSSSQPRSGLATPSPGESPAHTPAIEPRTFVPESESALYSSLSPTSPDAMEGGMGNPSSAYATREADIASAIKLSPTTAVPELGAAEKESQTAFLASHQNADSPISDAAPRSRSESPNKGRVQELAGKFGDVSSRRGSTQSNASGNSIQSWEKSPEHSRPSSPTKPITTRPISPTKQTLDERPAAAREVSFRPKLPGQWESYATTNATPSDQGDRDMQISGDNVLTPDDRQVLSPLDEVDLTPTTAKHPVLATDPSKSPSSPSDALAALKAAGAAMGEAIQASVGLGASSSQSSQDREEQVQGNTYGDVYLSRPLQLDRTASSNSSIPPTPPAKDSPESEDLPPPPPLKEKSPEPFSSSSQEQTPVRPTPIPQLSTETSMHDQESDRLRKEIVASLTPLKTSDEEHNGPSLQPTVLPEANRASSILPSEYDSYWADGDHTSPRPSTDIGRNVSEHPRTSTEQSPVAARSTATEFADSTKPPVLDRHFSWEGNQAQIISPEGQAQTGADAQALKNPEEEKQVVSSTTQQATDNAPSHSFQGIPDPYFGPSHVTAVSKPDHVNESDIAMRSPTPPPNSEKPLASPTRADTVKEVSHATGLHVVNTEMNPEAVDMPPRLSAQTSLVSQQSLGNAEESAVSRQQESHEEATTAPVPDSVAGPSTTQDHDARSPTSDKPLGFREIVTMKSPSERIATYNKTRDYWANADHGLNDWIASAVAANPQLASQTPLQHRPTIAATATSRHKPAGSLSLFGKKEGSSSTQPPIAPYYEQYNSAASQVPSTPTSSGAPAEVHPQSSSTGASGGRSTSHQMQTKGKDLLHTAGVLGGKGLGKGMTSAKGLFAKGKSRFRASGSGDKVDN
ncbi:hypothetical protein K505DRAFT_11427 [Melanomma pulvis-pyrius CBS 109.77]|uniref:Uncharacterized protein n=1 Tax=Melanomma pulvis-pyrius CBS 109.77 TaxID=1314802 RepID=A0A6A6XG12_9PLEO|nr:hypothetical protein K505DRAFT_11427 [Melanomma pulvis-pyrius CBS 109.77]